MFIININNIQKCCLFKMYLYICIKQLKLIKMENRIIYVIGIYGNLILSTTCGNIISSIVFIGLAICVFILYLLNLLNKK